MRVPPVYEPLPPVSHGQLTILDGESLEVDRGQQPEPIAKGSSVGHERGLHQADLTQCAPPRNRIGIGIERHRVGPEPHPGAGLGPGRAAEEYQRYRGQPDPVHEISLTRLPLPGRQ
jgi:hypothetical protein